MALLRPPTPSLRRLPPSRPSPCTRASHLPPPSLARLASFSSSPAAGRPQEPFRPPQSPAQAAARAAALRDAAVRRAAALKLAEGEARRVAAAAGAAGTRTARPTPAAAAAEDGPDKPHPTVERLRRERAQQVELLRQRQHHPEHEHEPAPGPRRPRARRRAGEPDVVEAAEPSPFDQLLKWYLAMPGLHKTLYVGLPLFALGVYGHLFVLPDSLDPAAGRPTTERAFEQDTAWMRAELAERERRRRDARVGGGPGMRAIA